jgi:hypothetical protein
MNPWLFSTKGTNGEEGQKFMHVRHGISGGMGKRIFVNIKELGAGICVLPKSYGQVGFREDIF